MELIMISQTVCSGCRLLENYLNNEHPEVKYKYINIDKEPEMIDKYSVTSTPTLILWDSEDNEESMRHTGFNINNGDDSLVDDFVEQLD